MRKCPIEIATDVVPVELHQATVAKVNRSLDRRRHLQNKARRRRGSRRENRVSTFSRKVPTVGSTLPEPTQTCASQIAYVCFPILATRSLGFDTLELLLNLLRCHRSEVLFFVLAFVLFDHLLELLTLSLSFAKADRC